MELSPPTRLSEPSTGTANLQHMEGPKGILSPTDPQGITPAKWTAASIWIPSTKHAHLSCYRQEGDFPPLSGGISSLFLQEKEQDGELPRPR